MADLQDFVNSLLAGGNLDAIADHVGESREDTGAGIAAVLPTLLGALAGNTSSPQGEQALAGALERDHDGSLLGQVSGLLDGSVGGPAANGAGILGHLFGDDSSQDQAVNSLAGKTNVSSTLIRKLLPVLAPMLLSYLGKQMRGGQQSQGASGSGMGAQADSGLGGALGSAMGGGGPLGGLLGGLLGQMMGGGASSGGTSAGGAGGGLADILGGLIGGGAPADDQTGGREAAPRSQPDLGSILGSIFGK